MKKPAEPEYMTLKVATDLHTRFKTYVASQKRKIQEVVNEMVEDYLKKRGA